MVALFLGSQCVDMSCPCCQPGYGNPGVPCLYVIIHPRSVSESNIVHYRGVHKLSLPCRNSGHTKYTIWQPAGKPPFQLAFVWIGPFIDRSKRCSSYWMNVRFCLSHVICVDLAITTMSLLQIHVLCYILMICCAYVYLCICLYTYKRMWFELGITIYPQICPGI